MQITACVFRPFRQLAQLQLTRNYIQLRDAEVKALEYLTQQYRRVIATYTQIPTLRARREAQEAFLTKLRARIDIGKFESQDYLSFLDGQRNLADAIRAEFAAIAQYNSALAQFEFAKGTILRYNNIHLQEGPLPAGVQKRAADHERERTAAIKLRERPAADTALPSPQHELGPAVGSATLPPIGRMPPSPDLGPNSVPANPKKDPGLPMPNPLPNKNSVFLPPATGGGGDRRLRRAEE